MPTTGQYRILTPDEYAAALAKSGDTLVNFHQMVGAVPQELGWRHLRPVEEAFL